MLHGNSAETGHHGNSLSPLAIGGCWEMVFIWGPNVDTLFIHTYLKHCALLFCSVEILRY